jgi:hypothetical protein
VKMIVRKLSWPVGSIELDCSVFLSPGFLGCNKRDMCR